MTASPVLLSLVDVAGARGGRTLFAGVSCALAAGGAALVTGPNGAGKSTLMRIAAGLLPAHSGEVRRSGAIGWLGEAHALDPERPLGRALHDWIGERTEAALARTGLGALAALPVRMLSTGQRRRAGLARVLGSDVPIWLLDEPANGLDDAGVTMLEQVIAAHRSGGGAVMVATHLPLALPDAAAVRIG